VDWDSIGRARFPHRAVGVWLELVETGLIVEGLS